MRATTRASRPDDRRRAAGRGRRRSARHGRAAPRPRGPARRGGCGDADCVRLRLGPDGLGVLDHHVVDDGWEHVDDDVRHCADRLRRDPGGDRRSVSGRRLERPRRPRRATVWCVRTSARASAARPAPPKACPSRSSSRWWTRARRARRRPAPRSTRGTATARAATSSTRRAVTDENYLRGVQVTGADGKVRFTSIYPGLLLGPVAARALRGVRGSRHGPGAGARRSPRRSSRSRRTSARPCIATSGYEQSVRNLAQVRHVGHTCSATTAPRTRSRPSAATSPTATPRCCSSACDAVRPSDPRTPAPVAP